MQCSTFHARIETQKKINACIDFMKIAFPGIFKIFQKEKQRPDRVKSTFSTLQSVK
ncbi:MAG: hypothetical protein QG657_194 [Acidobacteriota bacterium]|nr:hypothetical protein [Acidobacteriota bacterium]